MAMSAELRPYRQQILRGYKYQEARAIDLLGRQATTKLRSRPIWPGVLRPPACLFAEQAQWETSPPQLQHGVPRISGLRNHLDTSKGMQCNEVKPCCAPPWRLQR